MKIVIMTETELYYATDAFLVVEPKTASIDETIKVRARVGGKMELPDQLKVLFNVFNQGVNTNE